MRLQVGPSLDDPEPCQQVRAKTRYSFPFEMQRPALAVLS
jgi:hypothetical protein